MPPSDIPSSELFFPHIDKVVHFCFYYIFFILWYYILNKGGFSIIRKRPVIISLLISLLFGTVVEVLQYIMNVGRSGDALDALANAVGAVCGFCTVILINALNKGLKRKN
ncbi:VanZ family protein [Sinomicrobium sp.]